LPYLTAEAKWAIDHEMARTIEDVLSRRTRALLLDSKAAVEAAPRVARLLAEKLSRDAAWEAEQVRQFSQLAKHYSLN
jgi:glycerol-3-phosphate dehydrogenase